MSSRKVGGDLPLRFNMKAIIRSHVQFRPMFTNPALLPFGSGNIWMEGYLRAERGQ